MVLTVGFDATAAARQRAGIGRYTRELLQALARRQESIEYRLFYCAGGDGELPELNDRFTIRQLPVSDRATNAVWHRARLPIPVQLAVGRFDLFHSPDFTVPPTRGRPTIVTIHDLAFLRHPESAFPTLRAYLEQVVPRSARSADHVIAVSENARQDVIELLGVPPERVTTVYEGVSRFFRPIGRYAALHRVHNLGFSTPYILSVGTLQPRKNYVRLLEAYALLRQRGVNHDLVIAGARGWMDDPIFQRIEELHLGGHVTVMTPDDETLVALYSAADAFVYPSLYEGFGIPPLEALACGAPTAVSNASSLPEVVGNAALLFDPLDVEAMAGAVEQILGDPELAERLHQEGQDRARQFSWDRAAEETVRLYRDVAARA